MTKIVKEACMSKESRYTSLKMIVILCLVVSVGRFSLDSYLPSLPSIAQAFHATPEQVQFTLTYYFFGYGISQFLYGPLSEKFGRRNLLLLGMGLFLIGGFLCAVSNTINVLIFARLLAGIGAGAGGVLARAIVSDWFPSNFVASAWAQVTTAIVISLTIGPALGGVVQQYLGFRYNFWLSFIYGVIVISILIFWLPETHHDRKNAALNVKKIVSSYLNILKDMRFIIYVACSSLAFAALTVFFQLSPFIFINGFGYMPMTYGLVLIWVALSYILGGQIVRVYSQSLSSNQLMILGAFLILLSSFLLILWDFFNLRHEEYAVIAATLFFVVGSRIIIPTGLGAGLKLYKQIAGYAAALSGGGQMLGSTLISYCVAQFLIGSSLHRLIITLFSISICILLLIWKIKEKKNSISSNH